MYFNNFYETHDFNFLGEMSQATSAPGVSLASLRGKQVAGRLVGWVVVSFAQKDMFYICLAFCLPFFTIRLTIFT